VLLLFLVGDEKLLSHPFGITIIVGELPYHFVLHIQQSLWGHRYDIVVLLMPIVIDFIMLFVNKSLLV
jgi:hypothetical protein